MSSDASFLERLRIGQRFECDGHKGIIRYVGCLEKSKNPNAIYAGVAWDDCTRGKHDGVHEGKRYFSCTPGCGSFVHPEKLNLGVSFLSAVKDRVRTHIFRLYFMTVLQTSAAAKLSARFLPPPIHVSK